MAAARCKNADDLAGFKIALFGIVRKIQPNKI